MVDRHVSLLKPFARCARVVPAVRDLLQSEEQQGDYATAKEKLTSTMMPMAFVSLNKFHRCKLQPGAVLSMFVHDMKEEFLIQLREKFQP